MDLEWKPNLDLFHVAGVHGALLVNKEHNMLPEIASQLPIHNYSLLSLFLHVRHMFNH